MLFDHCMMVMMYAKEDAEGETGMVNVKDPVKFIGFYYAVLPDIPQIEPTHKVMGLIPSDEEVKAFPILEESQAVTRDERPDFLSFSNFADAMIYLSSTGWEVVSHTKAFDRYDEGNKLQIHEYLTFKRRVM